MVTLVARYGLVVGILAVAVALGGAAAVLVGVTGGEGVRAVEKSEARLGGAPAPEGRAPIRHALPGYKWFGERDESRLPGRHLGSYVDVIETDDGVVLILDGGSEVVYEHDPENRSTTIAEDYPIPAVTPRQAFEEPDKIDLKIYEPPMAVAGDLPDVAAGKGDLGPTTAIE